MFRHYLVILICILVAFCGRATHDSQDTSNPVEDLRNQHNLYLELAPRGWILTDECDALLFSSLQAVATNTPFDIERANPSPGEWNRRPDRMDQCSSQISRDMLVGLYVYILHFNRLDLAEDLWAYGQDHNWKMGWEKKEFETRTILTPGMVQLLAKIIKHLGGRTHSEINIPQIYGAEPGFPSHLTMLHIYLNGRMDGRIGDDQLDTLRKILQHSPRNVLAQALYHKYTDGDQTAALSLLTMWPNNRLPTESDWCAEWRTQRSDDQLAEAAGQCTGNTSHSGGDFLFVSRIILGN